MDVDAEDVEAGDGVGIAELRIKHDTRGRKCQMFQHAYDHCPRHHIKEGIFYEVRNDGFLK